MTRKELDLEFLKFSKDQAGITTMIENQDEDSFPVFCKEFLSYITGEKIVQGPAAWDRKADLVSEKGNIVGHVTTITDKYKIIRKINDDILGGIRNHRDLDLRKKIYFFCNRRFLRTIPEREAKVRELRDEIITIDGRYKESPPTIILYNLESLRDEVYSILNNTDSFNEGFIKFLRRKFIRRLDTGVDNESTYLWEEYPSSEGLKEVFSTEKLFRLLQSMAGSNSEEEQRYFFFDILRILYKVTNDAGISSAGVIAENLEKIRHVKGYEFLRACFKSAARTDDLDSEDIAMVYDFLACPPALMTEAETNIVHLAVARFTDYLLTWEWDLLETPEFEKIMDYTFSRKEIFWRNKIIDLYLKLQKVEFRVSEPLTRKLEQYVGRISETDGDMHMIIRLNDPAFVREQFPTRAEFNEAFRNMAKTAVSTYHCKWYFYLYKTNYFLFEDEVEVRQTEAFLEFIRCFGTKYRKTSPFLIYIYLKYLVKSFQQNAEKTGNLREYEKIFIDSYYILFQDQVINLQFEYAVALYSFLENHNNEKNGDLICDIILMVMDNLHSIKSLLFTNAISDGYFDTSVPKGNNDIRLAKKWLAGYVEYLFNRKIRGVIRRNATMALSYLSTMNIQRLQNDFHNLIFNSTKDLAATDVRYTPSFYASVLTLLHHIPFKMAQTIAGQVFRPALEANNAILIRNSRTLFDFLFRFYHYGDKLENVSLAKDQVVELADSLNVRLLHENKFLKTAMAYFTGIHFSFSDKEDNFLSEFYAESKRQEDFLNIDRKQETRSGDSLGEGAVFPDTLLDIIKRHKDQSVFADVLLDNLNNPEIYNLFGTIISTTNRKKAPPDASQYLKAASFYRFAIFFSKMNVFPDQKYAFNYIDAKSNYYLLKPDDKNPGFFTETIAYLVTGKVYRFFHRDERTEDFFMLMLKSWKKLDPEQKGIILNMIANAQNGWIKEKTQIFTRLSD